MKSLKKVELHLHFDGSISKNYVSKLLNKNVDKDLIAKDKCASLGEYLEKFDLPISIMQDKKTIQDLMQLLIEDLIEDNVIYAEIRFCPLFHVNKSLKLEEVIDSILEITKKSTKVKINLILCMMRNFSYEDNSKIIYLARKYLNNGVVAIDLAGDEAKYDNLQFKELFQLAKENNIPYTIHSGEAASYKNVLTAIDYGAKRIGHGIRVIENKQALDSVIENKITLEVCPTSNVQTDSVKRYEDHPIKKLYEENILLTINTDNRTVSNITLNEEYEKLAKTFGFTKEDFKKMNINAINCAFLSDEEKEGLIEKLNK